MSLDMNPDIRAQWCAALRSGDYAQGKSGLHLDDSFCCLGVLCDLAVKAGILAEPARLDSGFWSFGGRTDLLPGSVQHWAGLAYDNPAAWDGIEQVGLAEVNDDGRPFAEIADLIDGGAS